MPLFDVGPDGLVPFQELDVPAGEYDRALEDLLWENLAEVTSEGLFRVQQRPNLAGGGRPALVALDRTGSVVVVHVRRQVGHNDLAECLEYAGWARAATLAELSTLYWQGGEAFWSDWQEYTGTPVPQQVRRAPRLIVVAGDLTGRTASSFEFLVENGFPVMLIRASILAQSSGRRLLDIQRAEDQEKSAPPAITSKVVAERADRPADVPEPARAAEKPSTDPLLDPLTSISFGGDPLGMANGEVKSGSSAPADDLTTRSGRRNAEPVSAEITKVTPAERPAEREVAAVDADSESEKAEKADALSQAEALIRSGLNRDRSDGVKRDDVLKREDASKRDDSVKRDDPLGRDDVLGGTSRPEPISRPGSRYGSDAPRRGRQPSDAKPTRRSREPEPASASYDSYTEENTPYPAYQPESLAPPPPPPSAPYAPQGYPPPAHDPVGQWGPPPPPPPGVPNDHGAQRPDGWPSDAPGRGGRAAVPPRPGPRPARNERPTRPSHYRSDGLGDTTDDRGRRYDTEPDSRSRYGGPPPNGGAPNGGRDPYRPDQAINDNTQGNAYPPEEQQPDGQPLRMPGGLIWDPRTPSGMAGENGNR